MFNILDFIDSTYIREYNKDTWFTPIEQAYLICYSRKTTIDEKLAAWKELLDIYDEEAFEMTHLGKMNLDEDTGKSNLQILEDTITICENALRLRDTKDGFVFEAVYYKDNDTQRVYFHDYSDAVRYLECQHQKCSEDNYTPESSAIAKITAKPVGRNNWFDTTFYFDNDMRLTTVVPTHDSLSKGLQNVAYLFIYIPLPFQKGDIVRITRLTDTKYGVIAETPDEEYYCSWLNKIKDSSYLSLENQVITVDTYDPKEGKLGRFNQCEYNPLKFDTCSDDELPHDQRNLILLREVCLNNLSAGQFVARFSHFGKDAHCKCL